MESFKFHRTKPSNILDAQFFGFLALVTLNTTPFHHPVTPWLFLDLLQSYSHLPICSVFPLNDCPIQPRSCYVTFVVLHSWLHSSVTASADETPTKLSAKLSSTKLLSTAGENHTARQTETPQISGLQVQLDPHNCCYLFFHPVLLKVSSKLHPLSKSSCPLLSCFLSTHAFASF